MKKIRIILTFIYCRDGDLTNLTRRILDNLKGNVSFPNPTPTLDSIEKALNEYIVALSNAGGRDRKMVSIKDDKKNVLRQLLMDLAQYVMQTARGDKTMLLSSGFDITPEKNNSQRLPPRLLVELGLPGQASTRVKRMARARAYIHQVTADPLTPDSVWKSETSIKPEHTFTGLESGARLWFRVIVVSKDGKQIHWEPVLRIIQ